MLLLGCASSANDSRNTVDAEVTSYISSLDDTRERPRSFAKEFATGSVPDGTTLVRYARYTYEPTGTPTSADGNATVMVKISEAKSAKEVDRKEWSLVKEGLAWKLKSAPLP